MQKKQVADAVTKILLALFNLIQKEGNFAQNMTLILSGLTSISSIIITAQAEGNKTVDNADLIVIVN